MTLNPRRYLKPSQILHCDGFWVIYDEKFSSWISRILVVEVRCMPGMSCIAV